MKVLYISEKTYDLLKRYDASCRLDDARSVNFDGRIFDLIQEELNHDTITFHRHSALTFPAPPYDPNRTPLLLRRETYRCLEIYGAIFHDLFNKGKDLDRALYYLLERGLTNASKLFLKNEFQALQEKNLPRLAKIQELKQKIELRGF